MSLINTENHRKQLVAIHRFDSLFDWETLGDGNITPDSEINEACDKLHNFIEQQVIKTGVLKDLENFDDKLDVEVTNILECLSCNECYDNNDITIFLEYFEQDDE